MRCSFPQNPAEPLCFHDQQCIQKGDIYSCLCEACYAGSRCEINLDKCIIHQANCKVCSQDAECTKATCYECFPCLQGEYCDIDIDLCLDIECQNGSICEMNESCSTWECKNCPENYEGLYCEILTCKHGDGSPLCIAGTCVHDKESDTFSCECPPCSAGHRCEITDVDVCNNNSDCLNGVCKPLSDCSGFVCECYENFYGDICQWKINGCALTNGVSPCDNDAACVHRHEEKVDNGVKKYINHQCLCRGCFSGDACEVPLPDICNTAYCGKGFCQASSDCSDYSCVCEDNYTGRDCTIVISYCYTEPEVVPKCNSHKQQGSCLPSTQPPNFYVCLCDSCFQGANCEAIFDICEGKNCNQGVCLASEDCTSFQCKCDENYTHALTKKFLHFYDRFSFHGQNR